MLHVNGNRSLRGALGATSRAALISMMRDALNGRFDVVLAEALDRFSQDQDENLRARQIVAFSACSRSNC
jgi:DNA invertase Pin-like site-specific DNA recombinase